MLPIDLLHLFGIKPRTLKSQASNGNRQFAALEKYSLRFDHSNRRSIIIPMVQGPVAHLSIAENGLGTVSRVSPPRTKLIAYM